MFDEIAPRYDLLNHVLSANIDRWWWRRTARRFRHVLAKPDAAVLDLCCGTGDMTLALHRQSAPGGTIIGADFSHEMLRRGRVKFERKPIVAVEADALQLPFPSGAFDLVVSAFGFRNLANYEAGLAEIHRILRPGGEVGILDFSEPEGVVGKIYAVYFRQVLPRIGTLISGVQGPYAYLPASVERFPAPQRLVSHMERTEFRDCSWEPYTFGIAGLFTGVKA